MPELIDTRLHRIELELVALARSLSPWIDLKEMETRYSVCSKTLLAMERRGDIPKRINGRWNRAEVIQWEQAATA